MIEMLLSRYMRLGMKILGIFLVLFSLSMMHFSIWQYDMINVRPIWGNSIELVNVYQDLVNKGIQRYADLPFQCSELWQTTIGQSYDILLSMIVVSWYLCFGGMFLIFISYYFDQKYKTQ